MKVFQPIQPTDTTLTSSNIVETDNPEWLIGTSYGIGSKVMIATTEPNIHRNYESLVASNLGNQPWDDDGTKWLDLGATIRWKMFDAGNSTQSTRADLIDVTVTPGQLYNAVALLNLSGLTAQVIINDPTEGEVYNKTTSLVSDSGVASWHSYYFTPIERVTDVVLTDLPSYPSASIQVKITEAGATCAMGVMAIGAQTSLGITSNGASVSIRDYSVKETDSFGNYTILERSFSKRADYSITLESGRVAYVQNFLTSLRSVPVIWIGAEDYGSTLIYGYYRDFDLVISDAVISHCSITVEGLT